VAVTAAGVVSWAGALGVSGVVRVEGVGVEGVVRVGPLP
jgi:hypothetical protein